MELRGQRGPSYAGKAFMRYLIFILREDGLLKGPKERRDIT